MNRKGWNIIYFIGLILPVIVYYGQFLSVALSNGSAPLFNAVAWGNITDAVESVSNLMPVTQFARIICGGAVSPVVECWTYGIDFILWLSIAHLIIDVFMLLARCLHKLFDKFGGAD